MPSLESKDAKAKSARLQNHFKELTDPRRRAPVYPLINIVVIAICAVISGADDFVSIAEFGRKKRRWLGRFLDLSAGIPSHDRFNAILAAIKPAEFEKCLLSWIMELHDVTDGQIIAIDGKTLAVSNTHRNGNDCYEARYYILSKYLSGSRFAEAVRGHWGIENSLHWQLDVTFQEDQCRVRKGHADQNLSILRRTALSLLKNESSHKVGVKNKRLTAAWDEDYRLKVLLG